MGTRSSSVKIWGWVVTWRTIPMQGPTLDAKLAAMGLNGLALLVRPWFVEASPTVEKAVSWQSGPTRSLVAKFPQCSIVTCSIGKNVANEATDGCVRTFGTWCRVVQNASEQLQLCELSVPPTFGFTTWEFSMVGGYTENPEKPHNSQDWGVGACTGMSACSGQYGSCYLLCWECEDSVHSSPYRFFTGLSFLKSLML